MSIVFQVLGGPGCDNALFVRVESGQRVLRLLFDCGEDCLDVLTLAEIQAIDHVLFSHLHMDHIGGFDSFFRAVFNRTSRPNLIWGPPRTAQIMWHRFNGFLWNLHADLSAMWYVHDVAPEHISGARFAAAEAFAHAHALAPRPFTGVLIDTPVATVEAIHLDHGTPSLGYLVHERGRLNVDTARLATLGLAPGPWLQLLKMPQPDEPAQITIAGATYDLAVLRSQLLTERPGDSLAYLTDFALDAATATRLVPLLQGCTTLVCESQYCGADAALAERNRHMTAPQAAALAAAAGVKRLVLFHLSERYRQEGWATLLAEARAIFPHTELPSHWGVLLGEHLGGA